MATKRLIVLLALVALAAGCDMPLHPMATGTRHSVDGIALIDASTGQCVWLGINGGRAQDLNVTPLRPEACAFHNSEAR